MLEGLDGPRDAAITHALAWVEQFVIGSTATVAATISVGLLGAAMLTGRIQLGSAIRITIGCFIIFNAVAISKGIIGIGGNGHLRSGAKDETTTLPVILGTAPAFDPYAGASTPR